MGQDIPCEVYLLEGRLFQDVSWPFFKISLQSLYAGPSSARSRARYTSDFRIERFMLKTPKSATTGASTSYTMTCCIPRSCFYVKSLACQLNTACRAPFSGAPGVKRLQVPPPFSGWETFQMRMWRIVVKLTTIHRVVLKTLRRSSRI